MALLIELRQRARLLKAEVVALYLAARDPRTPWYAKLLVAGNVAYALSPIDDETREPDCGGGHYFGLAVVGSVVCRVGL